MSANTDPAAILADLIRCPSVTPREAGALGVLEKRLSELGFSVERPVFQAPGTPDVENLFGRLGTQGPHLVFAGHTDVVPPGETSDWRHDPFSAEIEDGVIYGRGAVDMKGGIAAFLAATARIVEARGPIPGRLSFLITGDEEGPAINGTVKLLDWAKARGEAFDACLVGEPTNPDELGDMIKVGRRGSLSGEILVSGRQGHVAYPHLADNPVRAVLALADALMDPPLDGGSERFQPSNLEITSLDTGNPSVNVIPARTRLSFNVRFNDHWTPRTLREELSDRIVRAAASPRLRPGREPAVFEIRWRDNPSECFFTRDDALTRALVEAVRETVGRTPELSTSGGTSDARFIKDHCPVVEFGLVGRSMHMANECVALADLERLTSIYEAFIARWFAAHA